LFSAELLHSRARGISPRLRVPQLSAIGWMIVAALILRLSVIPFVYHEWLSPYNLAHFEQGNVARALLAGEGFGSAFPSHQPSAILTPVYPMLLAGIFRIFGIQSTLAVIAMLALNCLLSALACVPVYRMAQRGFGPRIASLAGWSWALSPCGIYFSAEWPWSTHLLLLCLCWMLSLAQQIEHSSNTTLWLGFGALSGFAGLVEPSVLVVVPCLLVLAVWQRATWPAAWRVQLLAAVLAMCAVLAPWLVRNQIVFHRFIPMRDSLGLELWLGNNGDSLHWRHGDLHPNHNPQELAEYNSSGELTYMDHKFDQARAYITAHPRWFAWMSARRAAYLWTGYWSFDPRYLREEPLDPPNIVLISSTTLLAFLGLAFAWRQKRAEALRLGSVLFLYPVLYYFTHPEAYRMRPLDPLCILLGCYAFQQLRQRLRHRLRQEPTVHLPLTAAGFD